MPSRPFVDDLVGRDQLLGRLAALIDRSQAGERVTVLVAGQAGIGKTSLVRAAAAAAGEQGARIGWGTCIDVARAPGYWPWTQLLNGLVRALGADRARQMAGDDAPLLAAIAPSFGDASRWNDSDRARLLLMDATARWLDALATEVPVVVVLDDLQWADESSLALLDLVARIPRPARVCLIGAYRHDELALPVRERLGTLIGHGEHLQVEGLDGAAAHALVERVVRQPVDRATTEVIHRRSGGHPLFVRELALLADRASGMVEDIPVAVRDAIERRIRRLPAPTRSVLEVAAVVGTSLVPDVIASALAISPLDVAMATRAAVDAAILATTSDGLRFSHDLPRETILDRIDPPRRVALHQAIGAALEDRMTRAGDVAPSELAHHFTAAVALDGAERAARWSLAAAATNHAALAFGEAAAQLRRLRGAVADAGAVLDDQLMVDVLLAEADALARAGSAVDARGLLRMARDVADRCPDADRTARVALATARLGARFAARRDEIVRELERALAVIDGTDPALEAQLAATLARELAHSVADDRPRAGPLSERALELGRRTGNPMTTVACLLARHDVLWTPGAEVHRAEIAREIVAVAQQAGDDERQAEGLLLLANALLEHGSSAFEAALGACLSILDRLDQPRHRYTAETRRACRALLRGRLEEAAERIESAAHLGERLREPDAGNVRMSQRLELVRARGEPNELRAFAIEAVAHWTGAPVHAHAVAAGFHARAGDLGPARQHVAVVLDLGTWRADRSYLWSVFVRELAYAAVALEDRDLCAQLLGDVQALAGSCGVNGAFVAFAGSHAHTAGLLAAALGQTETSVALLDRACATYERLGAEAWCAQARRDLNASTPTPNVAHAGRSMQRRGAVWHIIFDGREATVPHVKGLADIARLLSAPHTELHVLDLIVATDRSGNSGDMIDRRALDSYRRRLADLDDEIDEAVRHHDDARGTLLAAERLALLGELRRVTNVERRPRQFANHPAERARKAVAARVRDAIRKLEPVQPELAAHLERSIVTGTYCRYRPDENRAWKVDVRPVAKGAR
ncbi:MAG: ATP-binding protein [Pseudonocardiaceae bacterium]